MQNTIPSSPDVKSTVPTVSAAFLLSLPPLANPVQIFVPLPLCFRNIAVPLPL
jgi:hypothetical protein